MKESRLIRSVLVLAIVFFSQTGDSLAVKFVKLGATGTNSGNSWANAIPSLAQALAGATNGDEFWVAEGVYLPTEIASGQAGPRARSFSIAASISIYGGFAGDETQRSERDWNANPTVLSGNLDNPDSEFDNSFSVISNTSFATFFTIDGVTIRDGRARNGGAGSFAEDGAGAFLETTSATFANCKFFNNTAENFGGGVAHTGGRLKLLNCSFVANHASRGGAIHSAARFNDISHCTFASNSAGRSGAINNTNSFGFTTLGNSVFGGNDSFGSEPVIEVEGSLTSVGNVVQEDIGGVDDLVANPEFVDPPPIDGSTEGNVRLRGGTAGVGHGSVAGGFSDDTDMDGDGDTSESLPLSLDGLQRNASRPQAGAYELESIPASEIQFSGQRIVENQPPGTPVGIFNTVDGNRADFTYGFVSGEGDDDNASFTIDGIGLMTAEEFDFETKSTYTIRIRSTEVPGGFDDIVEQSFTINITDAIDQFLTIEALQPIAYEPRGGVKEGSPHIGRVRVSRSGEVENSLEVTMARTGATGTDSVIISPPQQANSRIRFDPGQTELIFEVMPLFNSSSLQERIVTFRLTPSILQYKLLNDTASVSVVKGPMEAFFLENNFPLPPVAGDSNANGVSDFLEYALSDVALPSGFAPPLIEFSGRRNIELDYTLALNRSAIDIEVLVEQSTDLRSWTDVIPTRTVEAETATHETVRLHVPGANDSDRGFTRLATRRVDRPENFTILFSEIPMVGLPAGQIIMGSPNGLGPPNELQQTNVQFTQPFWIGATEITQLQYAKVTATGPSKRRGDDLPVESITRQNAIDFCTMVNTRERSGGRLPEGYEYRLPTEAEWEYACRAGSLTPRSFSGQVTDYAWYSTNSFLVTHAVGQKLPNAWGLFDTYGNVSEWCIDPYASQHPGGVAFDPLADGDTNTGTVRGSNIALDESHVRSAFRLPSEPDTRSPVIGMRIVLGQILPTE